MELREAKSFRTETNYGEQSTLFEPWTDGRNVGYRVTRGDQTEYVYFSAASNAEPHVFVYTGEHGDPNLDEVAHYYDLL